MQKFRIGEKLDTYSRSYDLNSSEWATRIFVRVRKTFVILYYNESANMYKLFDDRGIEISFIYI